MLCTYIDFTVNWPIFIQLFERFFHSSERINQENVVNEHCIHVKKTHEQDVRTQKITSRWKNGRHVYNTLFQQTIKGSFSLSIKNDWASADEKAELCFTDRIHVRPLNRKYFFRISLEFVWITWFKANFYYFFRKVIQIRKIAICHEFWKRLMLLVFMKHGPEIEYTACVNQTT